MNVSDRSLVRIGRAVGLLSVVSTVAGITLIIALGQPELLFEDDLFQFGTIAVGFGAFAWIVLPGQPRNAGVWTLTAAAGFAGLTVISDAALSWFASAAEVDISPLPDIPLADLMAQLHDAAAVPLITFSLAAPAALFLVMTVGLLLFPDGRLPSPRWRWVARVAIVDMVVVMAALTWTFRPSSTVSPASEPSEWPGIGRAVEWSEILVLVLVAASFGSLVVRFRRSDETVRQQFRWIMWGGGALLAGIAWEILVGSQIPTLIGLGALIGSYGIAITKHRLYDIDVIISKTFVYGSLAAFIGGVYVAVVVGVGAAFGGGSDPNPVLAVVATALVAVAFQPVRTRLQKVANRIVYGRRATPYEVLSEFSRQVAATDESLLEPVARSLAEGTTATAASIWAIDGEALRRLSTWPESETTRSTATVGNDGEINIAEADVVVPIGYDGHVLGALALVTPAGQGLSGPDMELAEELTAGIGLALRNIRLTHALEDRVAELRESRRRIVTVQDETRRELERDLHDGAQQRLVALKVKLALAGQIATRDGASRTADFLGDLSSQADVAISELRDFARGVYPPLLEAEGLTAALVSEAGRMPVVVDVAVEGVSRYPKALEATVYFCVLEALHNVARHSQAASAQVTLHDDGESLRFEVRDAGVGFDRGAIAAGNGLVNMTDRVDAAGGSLTIASSPGAGTVVSGVLPAGVTV